MSLLLNASLLLFDGMADDPLCLLENQESRQSQWMVLIGNFGFDGDVGLLKIDGSFRNQSMPVRDEI